MEIMFVLVCVEIIMDIFLIVIINQQLKPMEVGTGAKHLEFVDKIMVE